MKDKEILILSLCGLIFSYIYPSDRYNVLKDSNFESNSEVWEELAVPGDPLALANRHSPDPTTPDPEYVGLISAMAGWYEPVGQVMEGTAKLTQEFIPRIVSDFDLDTSLVFWIRWSTQEDKFHVWGITIFSTQGDSLTFTNPGKQDTWTEVREGNIYELWKDNGLSETDSLYRIELWAKGRFTRPCALGETVSWDLVRLYSKRPDLDAEMVSIDSPDKLEEGYEPKATVKNSGALIISFPIICDISKDGEVVYSDTSQIDSLKPDSSIQITFKPYSGSISSTTYSLKFYALLEGDQNPANDTLKKTLTTTRISEKLLKTSTIQLSIFPNPTKKSTVISLQLPVKETISLKVYDATGRLIKTLVKTQRLEPKTYTIKWDGRDDKGNLLPSGVYFVRLETRGITRIEKVILTR